MTAEVLVPLADGVEEIEAVCIIDVLRRAGASVTAAALGGDLRLTASRGVKLVADRLITECVGETYALVALPGGMPGAENLRDSPELTRILKEQYDANRLIGAICAAPAVVLAHHGFLSETQATCHPSLAEHLPVKGSVDDRVVVDKQIVTSRAPGTALEFSLKLVEILFGQEAAAEVAKPMLVRWTL